MAIDVSRLNDLANVDEVVANERVRAYRAGTTEGSVAATGNMLGTMYMAGTGTPFTTSTATGITITAANLGTGFVTITATAAAQTMTLDTAANIQTYMNNNSAGIQVGDVLQCLIVNGGATNAWNLAPNASGGSFDANQTNPQSIAAGTSRFCNIRMTAIGAAPTYTAYF